MRKAFYILLILGLTGCTSCPQEFDYVKDVLETRDSIIFPKNWKILDEGSIQETKQRCYNACFQFNRVNLNYFIHVNKLKVDARTYGVFQPSSLDLLKKEIRELKPMPERWIGNTELYADTVQCKVYISTYY